MNSLNEYYILEGKEPVPSTYENWQAELANHRTATDQEFLSTWVVAETLLGEFRVKTIFTGHNATGDNRNPQFFVTEVFRGLQMVRAEERYRANTWDEALDSHLAVVADVARRPEGYQD